jgi:tetratricopeptide (TPR) repeat protein
MKRALILILIVVFLASCAAKETRMPSKGVGALTPTDEDTYKPLPGDENIKNSEVAYNLSLEYAGARNMPAAHHYLDLAMKIEPHAKYSYTKGIYFLGEKRYEKALAWLNKAMSQEEGELQAKMDILNAQGIALLNLKRYDEAKEKFREIINTEGMVSKFNAYYNIGLIYLEENNYEDAENALRKAVEENPNDYRVYSKLGKVAIHKGDYLSAYGDYQKAADLIEGYYSAIQSDGPEIYYCLGESLVKLNRIEEGRNAFLKVIKIAPEGQYGLKAKQVLSKLPVE